MILTKIIITMILISIGITIIYHDYSFILAIKSFFLALYFFKNGALFLLPNDATFLLACKYSSLEFGASPEDDINEMYNINEIVPKAHHLLNMHLVMDAKFTMVFELLACR